MGYDYDEAVLRVKAALVDDSSAVEAGETKPEEMQKE